VSALGRSGALVAASVLLMVAFTSWSPVDAAPATHFNVSVPATATAGTPIALTVTALDAGNATDTSYGGTVHSTSSDGAAILPADATLTNGAGAFAATLTTISPQTITATDTVTASITGTSNVITVTGTADLAVTKSVS